ncbi:hypothetical protein Nepgr_010667 [Nepenthes gracilis]|uniref:START domain-containing protein n=1 Tax=Nepenthes gracilis TaxID=150966 RepID=A0AAD3SD35_NEPGR|nr:hypothetical protein Nepgr_010667 [Nepenthes gracilis]
MALIDAFGRILETPTLGGIVIEIVLFIIPVWVAFFVGLMVGWAWRPSWASLNWNKLDHLVSTIFSAPSSPSKASKPSPSKAFGSTQILDSFQGESSSCSSSVEDSRASVNDALSTELKTIDTNCSSLQLKGEEHAVVTEDDLRHLYRLVEVKDGGPSWIQMMDRSTPTMSYRAWRRDPETGPPQYRSSTIFEDATPEMVRDFFWDDEFRLKWDDMLLYAKTIEECPTTGTMIVHWMRKFPFFCSDREYIIGRRSWVSGRTYYCVTKGVPFPSLPRHDKPRRVDLYYSSWCIRAVESKRRTAQMSACEVLLFHHEDMGIPWEIAKLGVRQGMWGAVKKIEPGLRAYQKATASAEPLSRPASMAHFNTKVSPEYLRSLLNDDDYDEDDLLRAQVAAPSEKPPGLNIPKLLVFGGAIVLACSLDRGLLTKAVVFGVARRFGRIGGKL